MSNLASKFSEDEVLIIFEAARVALADGDIFDKISEEMDIHDDDMVAVRDKLGEVLSDEGHPNAFGAKEEEDD